MVQTLINVFSATWNAVYDFITFCAVWLWDHFSAFLYMCWQWMMGILPEDWQHMIGTNPFPPQVWTTLNVVDQFIPWKIILGIWVFSVTIIMGVRLVRWVLGISIFGVSGGT